MTEDLRNREIRVLQEENRRLKTALEVADRRRQVLVDELADADAKMAEITYRAAAGTERHEARQQERLD